MKDKEFNPDIEDLEKGLKLLFDHGATGSLDCLPLTLPKSGIGSNRSLQELAPIVLGQARHLGASEAMAHMDPPTPWVSWVSTLWNASLNQNLLHPDVAPVARDLEARVIDWIAPFFGMDGGHMTPGSTLSNLTAIWAARELKGVRKVIASKGAHLSIGKAAHLLGLDFETIEIDEKGAMDASKLPSDLTSSVLVLTAGATSTGAIDPLNLIGNAAWTHVDAAWSGPLRFSSTYKHLLDGLEKADSVAISAHKWLFQPKESALVLFKDTKKAHPAISFGGAYLALPNIGVLGSHGAVAVPLLATMLAWGQDGLAKRIEQTMSIADDLYQFLSQDKRIEIFSPPQSAILLWRPKSPNPKTFRDALPSGMSSLTEVNGQGWIRQVCANPMADLDLIVEVINQAFDRFEKESP